MQFFVHRTPVIALRFLDSVCLLTCTCSSAEKSSPIFCEKMNSDAASIAFKQIECLLNDHDVDQFMLYVTPVMNTRKDTTINTNKQAIDKDMYNQMIWWRHFCHVNSINWITTTNERQIEEQARKEGIQMCNHKQLQKRFCSYDDSSDSSDDGDYQPATQRTAICPYSFEKSLIFNLSCLKQETLLKPLAAAEKRKFDEFYNSSSSDSD